MRQVSSNSPLRLFYHTNGLASGETVIFDIWDDGGTQLYDDIPATEVGTEGVYYLDIVSPNENMYLLVVGSNNHFQPKGEVIKVGSPNTKAFYLQGAFKSDLSIPYNIYNETGVDIQSGTMTSVVSGFYSVSVSAPEPWFMEVPPWAIKNQEDLPAK